MSGFRIAGVLLAAGGALRMGSPKQLLRFNGVSLVRRAALELQRSRCAKCFAVVGANESKVVAEFTDLPIEMISNPGWQEGIGGSIRCAVDVLTKRGGFDAALFALADQPFVTREQLDALIGAYRAGQGDVVASQYGGAAGVPALFGSERFAALRALEGDRGAKSLLANAETEVVKVAFEEAAFDIDTPEDYERLRRLQS